MWFMILLLILISAAYLVLMSMNMNKRRVWTSIMEDRSQRVAVMNRAAGNIPPEFRGDFRRIEEHRAGAVEEAKAEESGTYSKNMPELSGDAYKVVKGDFQRDIQALLMTSLLVQNYTEAAKVALSNEVVHIVKNLQSLEAAAQGAQAAIAVAQNRSSGRKNGLVPGSSIHALGERRKFLLGGGKAVMPIPPSPAAKKIMEDRALARLAKMWDVIEKAAKVHNVSSYYYVSRTTIYVS